MFLILALLTSFISGLIACLENDLKRVVAISTLRQLGLMIYAVSLGEVLFSFFHIVCHALFKALLFLRCGIIIIIRLGGQDMRLMGRFSALNFNLIIMFMVSRIRLFGFPFIAGFFSKDLLLERRLILEENVYAYFMFLFCCVLTFIYRIRLFLFGLKNHRSREKSFSFQIRMSIEFFMIILLFWAIRIGKLIGFYLFEWRYFNIMKFDKMIGLYVLAFGFVFVYLKI